MRPRPIHRWKSFWFGLLVLVFMGWAWVRAISFSEKINWVPPNSGDYITIGQSGGRVVIDWGNDPLFDRNLSIYRQPSKSTFYLGAPVLRKGEHQGWELSFAHWFLVLLFLVPWLSFLAWRWRRMNRHDDSRS